MILKTQATPLRIRGYSNTSHIVTWLSPEAGRLTTVVKGACRPKSAFLGQYDLFYTCELLYYARERDGLHIARECTPLEFRASLRYDWRAMLCAAYTCDVLDHVAENSPPGGSLYALLQVMLDRLANEGAGQPLLLWFEARLLSVLGLAPDLAGCPKCHDGTNGELRFAVADGRLICTHCNTGDRRSAGVTVSRSAVASLRDAGTRPVPAAQTFAAFSDHELLALRRFLGIFMRYHLDMPFESRGIAWGLWTPSV